LLLVVERFQAEKGRPWVTPHLLTDACVGLVRLAIIGGLLGGFALGVQALLRSKFHFLSPGLLDGQPAWLQFCAYFVIGDFVYYAFHRMMHSTKPLWVFHAVHHSQRQANPMMQNRSHPMEEVLYLLSRGLAPAILGGSPPVIIAFIVVDQFWGYFVHSDIKINLGPLKYVLVTPQYHRIHHSNNREHFDKNFGGRLIIWDYLFGTLNPRFDEYPEIGLDDYPVTESSTFLPNVLGYALAHFLYPFKALWNHFVLRASGSPGAGPTTTNLAGKPASTNVEQLEETAV
jgi:sterol desaturase/sphingolipid hydroxylase (fatty acid hydroxylase superfamily)